MKKLIWAAVLLFAFVLGVLLTRWYFQRTHKVETENSTILLERIKQVAKLVTVEGYFSEIYDYKDYYGYDMSFFTKKALLKVKAKVSAGYDLEKMKVTAFPEAKIIRISGIPPVTILSIEHDIEYYDVQEGFFNSFTTEDYNKLNARAKEFIREKALDSELMDQAAGQRNLVFETIRIMAEGMGWEVEIEGLENDTFLDDKLE